MADTLENWLTRQYAHSRRQMLRSISRTDIEKLRPGFGQRIRAARGSVVASPELADWNPEPDYFFHWFRDSAIVIDALRILHLDAQMCPEALVMLSDFIGFSCALRNLDGRHPQPQSDWRERVSAEHVQYLRDEAELGSVRGEAVIAETRVNADGSLDISKWTRPQHDGAALRALALLRWQPLVHADATLARPLGALLRNDLEFVLGHWNTPAFDMWEEERGLHFHTLCVSAAALEGGADWMDREDAVNTAQARACRDAARQIRTLLDQFWDPDAGHYVSRLATPAGDSAKALDISVVFAAIHAWDGSTGPHTAGDPRIHATLEHLMALFAADYGINHGGRDGPAMGRYHGDHYFSGGAYYFSTLGAAELCFRAATSARGKEAAQWRGRGDAFLATVQAFTPASGDLSEQFDQRTGAQSSARHLAWSYASFISCLAARRLACDPVTIR